jgi:lipid II:glycine glycyltransferase (peptidoglycan interpeptide bridge formation enzyme)
MAYLDDKPVAAIIAFYNKYFMNGHLGGTLKDYLFMSPFSLLYSEMIKFGQNKGCVYLNVGGGANRNSEDKLLKYKLNFSKTILDFYIGKRIINLEVYKKIVKQWESNNPEKVEMYSNMLLKYHY